MTASTTAESRSALVASPGLAVWIAPSALLSRLAKVDHGCGGPARRDEVGLRVVADERHHLVAVLLQVG
jgi:hypothetical protein